MAQNDASFIAKISASIDSSKLASDIKQMNSAMADGLGSVDKKFSSILNAIKGKSTSVFKELAKSAEMFAKAFDTFSAQKDPFKNVKDSLSGVNKQVQILIERLERVQNLSSKATAPTGGSTSGGGSSSGSSSYQVARDKMIDLDIERKQEANNKKQKAKKDKQYVNDVKQAIKDRDQAAKDKMADLDIERRQAIINNKQDEKQNKKIASEKNQIGRDKFVDLDVERKQAIINNKQKAKKDRQYVSDVKQAINDRNTQDEITQLTRGQQLLPKKYKKMTYEQYINTIGAEAEKDWQKAQDAWAARPKKQKSGYKGFMYEAGAEKMSDLETERQQGLINNKQKQKDDIKYAKDVTQLWKEKDKKDKQYEEDLKKLFKEEEIVNQIIKQRQEALRNPSNMFLHANKSAQDSASVFNEAYQTKTGSKPLPKKYKNLTYDDYINAVGVEAEKAWDKIQDQYAAKRVSRVMSGKWNSKEDVRLFSRNQTPEGLSTEDFDKKVRGFFSSKGYSASQINKLAKEMHLLRNQAIGGSKDIDSFGQSLSFVQKETDNLLHSMTRLGRYYASFLLISSVQTELQSATDSAILFKDQMLEVQKFLPQGSSTAGLEKSMFGLGATFAVSMETVLGSYAEFAKQGKQVNEIADLTKASLLGVNVASTDYSNVVTYLTTATNVWNVATQDSVGLIDKLAYVQAKSSAESVHLITSMQRSAAMAKQYGLSLDEVLGYTAAVSEKTMLPGEVIGTSLKTLIERSQRLKTLQELSQIDAFKGVKFIDPYTGDMMKANEVLGLLASKWKNLTEVQQKSVGELIAGGKQINAFVALMENFGRAQELTAGSSTSWGYAMKANEVEMNKFSRTWQQTKTIFIEQSGGSLFTPMINSAQSLLKVFNYLATDAPSAAYGIGIFLAAVAGGTVISLFVERLMASCAALKAAGIAADAAAFSFKVFFASLGAPGWIGLLTTGIATVLIGLSEWTSSTNKQKSEQDSLNLSLSDTISKLLKINEIKKEDEKGKAKRELYQATPQEVREELEKSGAVKTVYTNQGPEFQVLNAAQVKAMQVVGTGKTGQSISGINAFNEAYSVLDLNKIPGTATRKEKSFKDVLQVFADYGKEINKFAEEYRKMYPHEAVKIIKDTSLNAAQKRLRLAQRGLGENTDDPANTRLFNLSNILKEQEGSVINFAGAINDKVFQVIQKITPEDIKSISENIGGMNATKYEENKKLKESTATNAFKQESELQKARKEAFDSYLESIKSETTRGMRGLQTPKYKMEFDYSAVETATKKMMDFQQKYNDMKTRQTALNEEITNAKEAGAGEESIIKRQQEYASLTEEMKILAPTIQRAEEAHQLLVAQLIAGSESATTYDKAIAGLISGLITAKNSTGTLAQSFDAVINKVTGLNSWVGTLISTLLSIPRSIEIGINALFNVSGASSIFGGIGQGIFGNVLKSFADPINNFLERRAVRVQAGDIVRTAKEAEGLGRKVKEGKASPYESGSYDKRIGELQTKTDNLRQKIDANKGVPNQADIDEYNKAMTALESAKKSSQKDPGAGAAKHESEDKAHQAALERIHNLEQQISVQKKIQSYWEGQLTDSFKRRWEREIGDLKNKAALYEKLSKEKDLKPDEVRSYQRKANEASAEAKLMEDRRKDVDKIQKRETNMKLFNRQLEESNKLFEYQQQIKSLDFEALTTTDTQKSDFQRAQQQEKLQFAMAQYAKTYTAEKQRTLDAITEEKAGQGAITSEVQARIQAELEEQMLLNENVQKAKERVVEEERATVALDRRLRNEILAKARQSVDEIKGTLSSAIQNMFSNSAAEEQMKRIKEVMDEIASLQKESEFAGYNVSGAEATGNVESINSAREKWFQVNQQMENAQKKLSEVSESTNKWKDALKNIGDVVLKKISEKFADLLMNKTGLGDQLMNMFAGIDGIGSGKGKAGMGGTMSGGGLLSVLLGGGASGSSAVSRAMGATTFAPTMTGSSTIVVNQSGGGGALGSLSSMVGQVGFDKKVSAEGGAAKTKTFGPLNYLTAAMLGYGIGSSTSNKAVGFLGGAAAGYLAGGPVGAIIGGIASLFGKKKSEEAPPAPTREFYPLAANTNALDANTRALTKISDGVFNAPSVFAMNKLQAENNAPKQVFNLNVNVSGGVSRSAAVEIGNTILQTVSQGLSQSAARTTSVPSTSWS